MEKIKANYKELLKTIVVTLFVLGYILFLPLYFGLTVLFHSKWSVLTNAISFICFLTHFIIVTFAVVCILKNKIKRSIQLILVFFLISALPIGVFPVEKNYYSNFTSKKWQRRDEARFLMIDDILEKNKLIGKDKKDISKLLGMQTPSEDVQVNIPKHPYEDYLVYYLGTSVDSIFHTEDDYLVIYFENSVVVKHKILTDTFDF